MQAVERFRERRIMPGRLVRVAAGFDEGAHRVGGFRLAEQDAVHAAAEDLAELPGIEAHIRLVGAVHRRFDDHRGRAVAGAGRAAIDEAAHVFGEPGHVEGAVLHADIDVVGPGAGILDALRMGQHVAGMRAGVVDRLVRREQLDGAVDARCHQFPPSCTGRATRLQAATASIATPTEPSAAGSPTSAESGPIITGPASSPR